MGFIGSLFDDKKGSGFQAQSAPIIQQDADGLKDLAGGAQGLTATANNMLTASALGQGPNPYLSMMQNATDQNNRQAAGMVASQKGMNPAMAARLAGQNSAMANQQVANQGATMKANQMLGAQQSLSNAAMGQQNMYQNAIQGQNQANIGNAQQQNTANANLAQTNAKGQQGIVGGVLNSFGAAAMMSDRRLKTDIKPGNHEAEQFLDSISPKSYEYKDPKFGHGQQTSVMAQDLEKTPAGKAMVMDTTQGKMVDYGKGLGVMTAALADIHQRLKAMEGSNHKGYAQGGMVDQQPSPAMLAQQHAPIPNHAMSFLTGKAHYAQGGEVKQLFNLGGDDDNAKALSSGVQSFMSGLGHIGSKLFSSPTSTPMTDAGFGTEAPALGSSTFGSTAAPTLGMGPMLLAQGGPVTTPQLAKAKSVVPGKAPAKGDSPSNDIVPAVLSPGEIVLPKSVTEAKDPIMASVQFVADTLGLDVSPFAAAYNASKRHGGKKK